MSYYLIKLFRKDLSSAEYCTNRIQQALQLFFVILDLFRPSFIEIKFTCM